MSRRGRILLVAIAITIATLVWQWFLRPYEWSPDPAARLTVDFASLQRDHSFHWLGIVLKASGTQSHDLMKPVRLITADGRELDPADTTLQGNPDQAIEALSLRFWLEEKDLQGPLKLRINDGTLSIRTGDGIPEAPTTSPRYFQTSSW